MAYGPLRAHFISRRRISIDRASCVGCKLCMRSCIVGSVLQYCEDERRVYLANALACGGCGACLRRCPSNAIHIVEERTNVFGDCAVSEIIAPGQRRPAS